MGKVMWEELDFEKASTAYPEIPSTVMIKIEACRRGVKLTQAAQKAVQELDIVARDYQLFSGVFDKQGPQGAQKVKIPTKFCLKKDDTVIQFRQNSNSPYTIDIIDNRFFFIDGRLGPVPLEEAYFIPQPKSLSKTLSDGTPYERVVTVLALDMIVFIVNYYCGFWAGGDECKFCDSGSYSKERGKDGLKLGKVAPRVAARVIKEVFENEPRYRHLGITGGTILDPEKEADFYCAYLNAINEAWEGVWYPSHFQIVAREEKYLRRIHDTGVPVIHLNMEVWDERLFNILCPGKARHIGYEEWIKRMIKGVNIFGRGKILTDFVAGVEMAQPWGFKDAHAAVKNTLAGADFLMEHDILPRFNMWASEGGSGLPGQVSPPLKYYIELFMGFMELVEKYKFSFPGPARCRAGPASDPTIDLWHYLHKEEPLVET